VRPISRPVRLAQFLLLFCAVMAAQSLAALPPRSEWQIAGKVISAGDGQPLSHAQVTLRSAADRNLAQATLTTGDGRFLFRALEPGKYVLQAKHHGFVTEGYQQHGSFFTGIAVGPDLPSPNLLFRLQPEGYISGKVVDEAGEPVRDAQVMLLHKSLLNGEWATRTTHSAASNDQGSYQFGQLLPGTYFVCVNTQPWYAQPERRITEAAGANPEQSPLDVAYPLTYYQDVTNLSDATPIDLQTGEHVTADVTLTAVPARHIAVRMADATSLSAFSGMLTQQVSEGNTVSVGVTFRKVGPGVFESTGVPPGNYEMELQFYDPKSGRQERAQTRAVDAGKEDEIDLSEPSASAAVSGAVRFIPAVKPPAHLFLTLSHGKSVFAAEISSHSEFVFDRAVPLGQYEVGSSFTGGLFVVSVTATGARVAGRTLQITSADAVVLRIVMSRGVGEVKGTAMRDSKPVSGALVLLVPPDRANNIPLFRADQSDSDGTFTLSSVVPGKYTVVAIDNGWGLEWRNPAALKPYLLHGEVLEVAPEGRYNIKPKVQDF
jgi:hypothetical protein